jgi:hypothetical protein
VLYSNITNLIGVPFGPLFIALAVAGIVTALAGHAPVGNLDLMFWITDLSIAPAWLIAGVLLLQCKPTPGRFAVARG